MKFVSKYLAHQLIMIPKVFKINEWGQREAKPGKNIQFDNGKYQTEDKNEIRFLLGHRALNVDFKAISNDGEVVLKTESPVKKDRRKSRNKGNKEWGKKMAAARAAKEKATAS